MSCRFLSMNVYSIFLRARGWALVVLALIAMGVYEAKTSTFQAMIFSQITKDVSFELGQGATSKFSFVGHGPYNERLGYVQLPQFYRNLARAGYTLTQQARSSPEMQRLHQWGLFPIYAEKNRAGLEILDANGSVIFDAKFPTYGYPNFDDIPASIVNALVYVENRALKENTSPTFNPAVEWDRFIFSAANFFSDVVIDDGDRTAGGSTLATQLEKFRHSPGGITVSGPEKLRQMVSASLRAYADGKNTDNARKRIIRDYVNSVPLSAARGIGEVNGIGDGMWAWYGLPFPALNKFLALKPFPGSDFEVVQAKVFKQMLSLVLAQRRPSYYLGDDAQPLNRLVNVYLDLLFTDGLISKTLRDDAKAYTLAFATPSSVTRRTSLVERKPSTALRARLMGLLGLDRVYDLDRLDLSVESTIVRPLQNAVTTRLEAIKTKEAAAAAGLYGDRLLREKDNISKIIYSVTLIERQDARNVLRVQTDNFDGPFNINEGVKLDLGSTAKLRTLATYLEIIAQLYDRFEPLDRNQLASIPVDLNDKLTLWAVEYLARSPTRNLSQMLAAALDRTYSASPDERFFTGGGLHVFENFESRDNHRVMSVRAALNDSVNLVFVRLMRDIARYYMLQVPGSTAKLLDDTRDERRMRYLVKFADSEGTTFVERFYRKHRRKSPEEILSSIVGNEPGSLGRIAVIYRSLFSDRSYSEYAGFALSVTPEASESQMRQAFDKYDPSALSLPDRGFLARTHPLELWVARFLIENPDSTLSQVVDRSATQRQDVYRWLFSTSRKNVQDARIRHLLEVEAFLEIFKHWKSLRYPFDSLVASYATALGSSGDRPAALAELMGIIVNDGMYYPTVVLDKFVFAHSTPYETHFEKTRDTAGTRVMAPEVAAALRSALAGVVTNGTGRRVAGVFKRADGSTVTVGGKTGTGDHRRETYSARGALLGSEVVNRTATFVFFIGDRYFGTVTAFVPGRDAANYKFTSGLPVQLLKSLASELDPYLR